MYPPEPSKPSKPSVGPNLSKWESAELAASRPLTALPQLDEVDTPLERQDLTVVLVEDNEYDVQVVRRAFAKSQMKVRLEHFACAKAAYETLVVKPPPGPFIILLDLKIPGWSGLDFLDRVRIDPSLKECVVFVLSTSEAARDRQAANDLKVAGYFVKGKSNDGIKRLIEKLEPLFPGWSF